MGVATIVAGQNESGSIARISGGPSSLDELRRRGVFLFSLLLWAACAGFALVAITSAMFLANNVLAFLGRMRAAAGLHAPALGPDWMLLGACFLMSLVPVAGLVFAWRWYRLRAKRVPRLASELTQA